MSKIESGQLEIYQDELDLYILINEIKALLDTQAEEKGLTFNIECDELKQPLVLGDGLRIKQVLTNLLGNAVKFTQKGGRISLIISQKIANDIAYTTFIVADNGSGMSPEFLERIWIPFEQEQRIASQNGTGLGTTLSKTLMEKMNGTISVESKVGSGTKFTVSVPFPIVKTSAKFKENGESNNEWEFKDKNVLVVEDNDINRMIVVSVMEDIGCTVVEVTNGQEAVDAFKDSSPYFFDLILMDMHMPVMDGYEAVKQIRALPRPDGATVLIIALTANAFREDVERALKSGVNEVATKPLNIPVLMQKIKSIQNREETR